MGTSNNVEIRLTVDEANAIKSWTSQMWLIDKVGKKIKDLKLDKDPLQPLQAGALKALGFLKDAAIQLVGIGSAIGGIMAVASQLRAEYENIKSRQGAAATTNIDYSKELARGIRATGGSVTAQEFEALVTGGAKRTGQAPTVVAQAFNAAFTALGPRNKQEVLEGTGTAEAVLGQYKDEDATTIKQLIAVTAQNRKVFGLTDQQSLGYQQKAQNMSFVKDVAAFATNVAGKLSAVAKSGDFTAAESGSLTGALSQAGGDLEGATSTMAALTLGAELKERLPFIPTGAGRIQYMQQNPAAAEAYFSGGMIGGREFAPAETGRSIYKPHIRDLFNAQSGVSQEFNKNVQAYGGAKDWEREAADVRKQVASVRSVQITDAKRAFDTGEQQLQIEDTSGAMGGVVRDGLAKILKANGESDLAQKMEKLSFEFNTAVGENNPAQHMAKQLEQRIAPLRSKTFDVLDAATGVEETYTKDEERLAQDAQKADALEQVRQSVLKSSEDLRTAQLLGRSQTRVEALGEARGGSNADKQQEIARATELVETMRREALAPSTKFESSDQLLRAMEPLVKAIDSLRESMEADRKAVEDNTRAQQTPGDTRSNASPRRTPNVTSLQNDRGGA